MEKPLQVVRVNFFLNQMNPAQIKKLQDKDELEKTLFNKLCDLFSIHIVNEANLTARAFFQKSGVKF